MQPWTCLWADCRLCNWIGLFSKLFKTSHLLKLNCFQTGVINGVLCLLFNFAVNRTASVFIQGPALLCTGWFTIQWVNVVAVWNKGEPVYPNKFEGEGEEVNCSLFTELQLESRTKRPQGKRDREMIGGAGLAQRPCNFRVVLTQGAQASCRGAQVPPGPLEELRWQLKTFCKWFLCFAQSSSSVVGCRVQCNLLAGVAVVPQSTVPLLIASTCPELKPANTFLGFKYSEYFSLIVKLEHFGYNS